MQDSVVGPVILARALERIAPAKFLYSSLFHDLIARYEYHPGNLYDGVSALARQGKVVSPHTEMGAQYGADFATLVYNLRQELRTATQALQRLKPCVEVSRCGTS